MYERLDRLREEVKRCEKRMEDAQERLKAAQAKLKEAEATQILSDVGALNLTPEQLAQFLQMAASGSLPASGQYPPAGAGSRQTTSVTDQTGYGAARKEETAEAGDDNEEDENREDNEDENN